MPSIYATVSAGARSLLALRAAKHSTCADPLLITIQHLEVFERTRIGVLRVGLDRHECRTGLLTPPIPRRPRRVENGALFVGRITRDLFFAIARGLARPPKADAVIEPSNTGSSRHCIHIRVLREIFRFQRSSRTNLDLIDQASFCFKLFQKRSYFPFSGRALAVNFLGIISAFLFQPCWADGGGAWEKLPDGRTIIEVHGIRLALPSVGPDLQFIMFHNRDFRQQLSLAQVLGQPAKSRQFFENSTRVHLRIDSGGSGTFLGKFDRSNFRSVNLGIAIGDGVQGNCEAWDTSYINLQSEIAKGARRVDADGWMETRKGGSPAVLIYVRDPQEKIAQPNSIRGLVCDPVFFQCSVSTCIGSNIGVAYQFSRRVFDRPTWISLNAKVQNILDATLFELNQQLRSRK